MKKKKATDMIMWWLWLCHVLIFGNKHSFFFMCEGTEILSESRFSKISLLFSTGTSLYFLFTFNINKDPEAEQVRK